MKIYMFYLKENSTRNRLEPFLYAYTNDKDLANRFMEFRNMDKFRLVKRDIAKDEWVDFTRVFPDKVLTKSQFKTKNPEKDIYTISRRHSVDIVCTWDEEKTVILESEEGVLNLFKDKMFDPTLLSLEMSKTLYDLGFFSIYQYLYSNMLIYKPLTSHKYDGVFSEDDMYYNDSIGELVIGDSLMKVPKNLSADQFEMFMYLFGGTVKTKERDE